MSVYEAEQLAAISAWKREAPGVATRTFSTALAPIAWLLRQVVPEASLRAALAASNRAGEWLADKSDIIRDGNVTAIEELRGKKLEVCDGLADKVHNWAIGLAASEGAATGAAGLPGLMVDAPLVVTLALRTVHKIGLCYGFEARSPEDFEFALAILAASGANDLDAKISALATLRALGTSIAKESWRSLANKAAAEQLSKEGAITAVRALAKHLGVNLTKRKALQVIPVAGALVGASANGWYMKDVGWAARRAFQERHMMANARLIDVAPLPDGG